MEQEYKYYAFISYKREDEKWAKWIQNRLERYRLPSAIRKEIPHLPLHIRPVFRDKTDLNTGILSENIHEELRCSKYLIVICSPFAATSRWVGKEILSFKKMGRTNRIIPFIINGTPNTNDPDTECLHTEIKNIPGELLGIHIKELGKEKAFIKIVAKLLDLRFDQLWKRFERHKKIKRWAILSICFALFLLFSSVYDYYRTKYTYYADYVDQYGLAEGVIRLSLTDIKKRHTHYRFEHSQGKLRRVIYANSAGTPVDHWLPEHQERAAIQNYIYTSDNRLDNIELKNSFGKTVASYFIRGKEATAVDLKEDKYGEFGSTLTGSITSTDKGNIFADPENNRIKANIKRYKLTRNHQGYIVRKEFKRHNGEDKIPACDTDGIYGFEYTPDSLGRILKIRYLDENNQLVSNKNGISGRIYTYDTYGNVNKISFINIHEQPINTDEYYSTMIRESNLQGNIIRIYYLDSNNAPSMNKNKYARTEIKYDRKGNRIEMATYGIDNQLCYSEEGIAKAKLKYDHRGYIIERACFDLQDNPCLNTHGVFKIKNKYDRVGNTIERSFWGTDDKLCMSKEGYALLKVKYDEDRNRIEGSFWDTQEEACTNLVGVAKWKVKYNKRGWPVETSYYNENDELCFDTQQRCAKFITQYDDNGNNTETSYFGSDGKPCLQKNNFAKIIAKYDERGNTLEMAYRGIDDLPCESKEGFARWTAQYDENGNTIQMAFWDIHNNPAYLCMNSHEITTAFYENENESPRTIYQEALYAKMEAKYNEQGYKTEISYYDINNRLFSGSRQYAIVRFTYDSYNKLIEKSYWDSENKRCKNLENYSIYNCMYDSKGNVTEETFYDTHHRLSPNSQGVAKWTQKYDDKNRVIEINYFGPDNKPCLTKEGIARITKKYNQASHLTEECYWGSNGKLRSSSLGYSKVKIRYDDKNRISENMFFDELDRPYQDIHGIFKTKLKYNASNCVTEMAYYDKNDSLCNNEEGCARIEMKYVHFDQPTDIIKYDETNQLIALTVPSISVIKEGRAYRQGMRDDYLLLELGSWEIGNPFSDLLDSLPTLKEKKKRLIALGKGFQLYSYDFEEGNLDLEFKACAVPKEIYTQLKKTRILWKEVHDLKESGT